FLRKQAGYFSGIGGLAMGTFWSAVVVASGAIGLLCLTHTAATAQMMCAVPAPGTAAMQAQRGTIPDNMKLRPGDTVVWEIGQGRHSVLFRPFGPGEMLDFNIVKAMFDFDLSQFVSNDPKEAFTKDERTPGKQLLMGKVKPEAADIAKLAEQLPFWCE